MPTVVRGREVGISREDRSLNMGTAGAIPAPACPEAPRRVWARTAAFWALAKPDVTLLVVVTTALGYCAGSRGPLDWRALTQVAFGTLLLSAGTAALNQYFERALDAQMRRTASRPLPAGILSPREALRFSVTLVLAGLSYLYLVVNPLSALLGACSAITYLALYTPLKLRTPWCTFVGAFPGAVPPLIGWAAARNSLDAPAWLLFAILFVWQFPHFLSIAWIYREDYARAGIRMLPVVQPDGLSTVVEALFYAVVMIPVSLAPSWLGMAGTTYTVLAAALGLFYLAYTIRFARILRVRSGAESRMLARDLLKVSVIYLPLLLTTLMLCATAKG